MASNRWTFDVGALMVLVGEPEELRYRLASRELVECLMAAPVTGMQLYLRARHSLDTANGFTYFSPYGCKSAPLRNMKFDNFIRQYNLLEDRQYTTLRIPVTPSATRMSPFMNWTGRVSRLMAIWLIFTWVCFISLLMFCIQSSAVTWVGLTNCLVYTGWSIVLRTLEYALVTLPSEQETRITRPADPDTAVFLGRGSSALVLEGSRKDIKSWTGSEHAFQDSLLGLPASSWETMTRSATAAVLLLVFATVPNGSTMDQLAFVLVNLLGQLNGMVGCWLNANACLATFERSTAHSTPVKTRTHVYARILRQFKILGDPAWSEKIALLPATPIWRQWRDQVVLADSDPKELYDRLVNVRTSTEVGDSPRRSVTTLVQPPSGDSQNMEVSIQRLPSTSQLTRIPAQVSLQAISSGECS